MTHIETAAHAALAGKRILVVSDKQSTINDTLAELTNRIKTAADEVSLKRSSKRHVEVVRLSSGGTIHAITAANIETLRGSTFDIVILTPRYMLLNHLVAATVAWATAAGTEPTILLHNPSSSS